MPKLSLSSAALLRTTSRRFFEMEKFDFAEFQGYRELVLSIEVQIGLEQSDDERNISQRAVTLFRNSVNNPPFTTKPIMPRSIYAHVTGIMAFLGWNEEYVSFVNFLISNTNGIGNSLLQLDSPIGLELKNTLRDLPVRYGNEELYFLMASSSFFSPALLGEPMTTGKTPSLKILDHILSPLVIPPRAETRTIILNNAIEQGNVELVQYLLDKPGWNMSHAFNWASFRSASKCGTASPIKSDLMLKFLLERVRVQDLLGDAPLHHFVGNAMTAAAENGNFAAFTHLRSRFPNVRINDEMFHAAIESLDYDLVSFMRSIDSVNWLGDEEIDVCELAITSYRGRRGLETVKLCCRDVEGKDISQDSFILSFDLIRIGSLDHRPNIALFDFLHREKGVIFDEKLLEHAAKNGLASLVRHVIDELGLVPSHQLLDVIAIRSARRDKYQRKGLHVDFKQTLIELKNNIRL